MIAIYQMNKSKLGSSALNLLKTVNTRLGFHKALADVLNFQPYWIHQRGNRVAQSVVDAITVLVMQKKEKIHRYSFFYSKTNKLGQYCNTIMSFIK